MNINHLFICSFSHIIKNRIPESASSNISLIRRTDLLLGEYKHPIG